MSFFDPPTRYIFILMGMYLVDTSRSMSKVSVDERFFF